MSDSLSQNKNGFSFAVYAFVIFAALSLIYLAISLSLQDKSDTIQKNEIINSEEKLGDVAKTMINGKIDRLASDVLYIDDSWRLNDSESGYARLKLQWLAFSNRKRIYDQIRFINSSGDEVVRVNYSPKGAYVVNNGLLQNKKDRYYFKDSMALPKNSIYVSKLDLNVEGKEIEKPDKPMVRLATPHFSDTGALTGIVVLNYTANDMLKQVREIASASRHDVYLLNASGYWLYDKRHPSREWSFMYKDRESVSFKNAYPHEWSLISGKPDGHFVTGNGLFTFTSIFTKDSLADSASGGYALSFGEGDYYLVTHVPPDSAAGRLFNRSFRERAADTLAHNIIVYLLLGLLAVLSSTFMVIKRNEKEEIRYFSEVDTMTGVYNRRMAFAKMNDLYEKHRRDGSSLSICFVDINGLKEVNDTLGHDDGDELIKTVAKGISDNVRGNDIVARLGGDEFIIVFDGLGAEQAEAVWRRIRDGFDRINAEENRKYMVSASHGIETAEIQSRDYIDTMVNSADEKMYQEKRLVKKDLKVIKPR